MDYEQEKLMKSLINKDKDNCMRKQRLDAYDAFLRGKIYCNEPTVTITELPNNNKLILDIKNNIKDVIFNEPATIVFWKNGDKTVVKCQDGDTYSKELGMAMCIIKGLSGNKGNYNDIFNKWIK